MWFALSKFEQAIEWLKNIREGICPECSRKLEKRGSKRECSQGHLTVYGNPEYVAYHKIHDTDKKQENRCETCKKKVVSFDRKHDELVCVNTTCEDYGMVLSGPPHSVGYGRWVKYPLGNRYNYEDVDETYSPYEL